jgi:hypothetical protein
MDKEKTVKRLKKLRQYKKYSNLSNKCIFLAINIVQEGLIMDADDIKLCPNEDHITIEKLIIDMFPIIWLSIEKDGEIRFGQWLSPPQHPDTKAQGWYKVVNYCNWFNHLCHKIDKVKPELKKQLLKASKNLKGSQKRKK